MYSSPVCMYVVLRKYICAYIHIYSSPVCMYVVLYEIHAVTHAYHVHMHAHG